MGATISRTLQCSSADHAHRAERPHRHALLANLGLRSQQQITTAVVWLSRAILVTTGCVSGLTLHRSERRGQSRRIAANRAAHAACESNIGVTSFHGHEDDVKRRKCEFRRLVKQEKHSAPPATSEQVFVTDSTIMIEVTAMNTNGWEAKGGAPGHKSRLVSSRMKGHHLRPGWRIRGTYTQPNRIRAYVSSRRKRG